MNNWDKRADYKKKLLHVEEHFIQQLKNLKLAHSFEVNINEFISPLISEIEDKKKTINELIKKNEHLDKKIVDLEKDLEIFKLKQQIYELKNVSNI